MKLIYEVFTCIPQCTPLHLAAINGQLKVMKLLFASQADVTIKDWENMNCLDHAIKQGHEYVGRGRSGGGG